MVWRSQICLVWNPTKSGTLSHQPTSTANPARQAESAVLVSWWLRVPYFVGFKTKQIWDLHTMLYHPAKVPSLGLTLSLDSPGPYCALVLTLKVCIVCSLRPQLINTVSCWDLLLTREQIWWFACIAESSTQLELIWFSSKCSAGCAQPKSYGRFAACTRARNSTK